MKTDVIQDEPYELTEEKSLIGIAGITTGKRNMSDGWSPSSTTPCSSTDDPQSRPPARRASSSRPKEKS